LDLFDDTYCHQCRTRTKCEPVAKKDDAGEVTVKVLCSTCRSAGENTRALDEELSNVKRWMLKLRRSNKPHTEKRLTAGAYLYELLRMVADSYVPEPQRGAIEEILNLDDSII
jgi:hypothetical protein